MCLLPLLMIPRTISDRSLGLQAAASDGLTARVGDPAVRLSILFPVVFRWVFSDLYEGFPTESSGPVCGSQSRDGSGYT